MGWGGVSVASGVVNHYRPRFKVLQSLLGEKKERHGNLRLVINVPGSGFKSLRERDGPVFDCVIYSPSSPTDGRTLRMGN